jgi:biopolymer transport protein TolR
VKNHLRPFADINITSVADVAITLLIIFIITGSSGSFQRTGVTMNLPRTSAAKVLPEEGVTVSVTRDLKITVDKSEAQPGDFIAVLTKVMKEKAATQVYLKADAAVPYGVVIDLVGKVKEAGYENLGLMAEPKAPSVRRPTPVKEDTGSK